MKKTLILLFIISFISPVNSYSLLDRNKELKVYVKTEITGGQLKDIAIKKGLIPENVDDFYIEEELERGNTILVWLVMNKKQKILTVNMLKKMLKKEENAVIKGPSSYYVNLIDSFLYDSIAKGDTDVTKGRGLKSILKTIAILEGNYNNGKK